MFKEEKQKREDVVIRKIFEEYLKGATPQQLALQFSLSVYEVTRILRDESLVESKKIPKSLFEAVNLERTKRKRVPNQKYPLTGILICGKCGSNMIGRKRQNYYHYCCKNYLDNGRAACGQKNILGTKLEQVIIEMLKQEFSGIEKHDLNETAVKIIKKEINNIDKQIQDLKDKSFQLFINQDSMSKSLFEHIFGRLDEEIKDLEKKKEELSNELVKIRSNDEYQLKSMVKLLDGITIDDKPTLGMLVHFFVEKIVATDEVIEVQYRFNTKQQP